MATEADIDKIYALNMGEEDFALNPLHFHEDAEHEEDAKNDDTFGEFAAVDEIDDNWRPDEGAVGVFEALRAATHQQRLRLHPHQQQQNFANLEQLQPPPQKEISAHNSLHFVEQSQESSRRVLGATPGPPLRASDPHSEFGQESGASSFSGADAGATDAAARRKLQPSKKQHEQACFQQQRRQEQLQKQQQQQSQAQQPSSSSGPPPPPFAHKPAPFPLLSSRSSVTEQLDKLIAFKRQQQQQTQQQTQQPLEAPSAVVSVGVFAGPSLSRSVASSSSSAFPPHRGEEATPAVFFARQSVERATTLSHQQLQASSQRGLAFAEEEVEERKAAVVQAQTVNAQPPRRSFRVEEENARAALVAPALHHPARRGSFDSGSEEADERMVMQMLTDPSVTAAALAALNAAEAAVGAGAHFEPPLQQPQDERGHRGEARHHRSATSPVKRAPEKQQPHRLLQLLHRQTTQFQTSASQSATAAATVVMTTPLEAATAVTSSAPERTRASTQQQMRPALSLPPAPLAVPNDLSSRLLPASAHCPESASAPPTQQRPEEPQNWLLRRAEEAQTTFAAGKPRVLTEAEVLAILLTSSSLSKSSSKTESSSSSSCASSTTQQPPAKKVASPSFPPSPLQRERHRQLSTAVVDAVPEKFDSSLQPTTSLTPLVTSQSQALQGATHSPQSQLQRGGVSSMEFGKLRVSTPTHAPRRTAAEAGGSALAIATDTVPAAPLLRRSGGAVQQPSRQVSQQPLQEPARHSLPQNEQQQMRFLWEEAPTQRAGAGSAKVKNAVSKSSDAPVGNFAGSAKTTEAPKTAPTTTTTTTIAAAATPPPTPTTTATAIAAGAPTPPTPTTAATAIAAGAPTPPTPSTAALAQVKAAGLFPLTGVHRRAALAQSLSSLAPWRVPVGSLEKDPQSERVEQQQKSVQAKLLRKPLMTAFDLDCILRLQLTNMAKLPQLQLISGRWNFRFLRNRQAASSSSQPQQQSSGGVVWSFSGESGASLQQQQQQQQQQFLLPSSPLEMEQHLRRLLLHQQTLKQQFPQVWQFRAAAGAEEAKGGGEKRGQRVDDEKTLREEGSCSSSSKTGEGEQLLLLLPEALERKLHGGCTGVVVVSHSARMHRLLLGSLSVQEVSELLQPLLREGAPPPPAAAEACADYLRTSSSGAAAAEAAQSAKRPSSGEPLEAEPDTEAEELAAAKTAALQQQKQQQQPQKSDASAQERELRRLQKRFGKPTYCTVRQPRSSIHVGSATAAAAVVGDGDSRPAAVAEEDEAEEARLSAAATGTEDAQQTLQSEQFSEKGLALAGGGGAGGGGAHCADDSKSRRRLVRSLVFGGSSVCNSKSQGAATFAQHLTSLRVIEDAFDVLLEAEALEDELVDSSASHAHARRRLLEQQQHFSQQLLELLLLRRCVVVSGVTTPDEDQAVLYTLDVHPSACVDSIEAYVSFFRRNAQQQPHLREEEPKKHPLLLEQNWQPSSSQPHNTQPKQLELTQQQQQLTVQVEEGRECTRWMLTQVYSNAKGRQLLLRALLLFSETQAALLLQGLCSSATVLQSVCAAADAALVQQQSPQKELNKPPAPFFAEQGDATELTKKKQQQQQKKGKEKSQEGGEAALLLPAAVSCAELFEDLLLLLDGNHNVCNVGRGGHLLSLMRETTGGLSSFAAPLYVQVMQLLLRLGSRSSAGSVWFMTGLCQQIVWGLSLSALVKLLQWRSACCLFASIVALLPAPACLSPDQSTAMLTLLNLVVTALLTVSAAPSSSSATALEEKNQREQLLAPLVQAVVQQAHLHEARAQAITTAAV